MNDIPRVLAIVFFFVSTGSNCLPAQVTEANDSGAETATAEVIVGETEPSYDGGQIKTVRIDGQLFSIYRTGAKTRPSLFPILGPGQLPATRAFPFCDELCGKYLVESLAHGDEGESNDHPHHRSFWFAHGDVNGHDFWTETRTKAKVVHRQFLTEISGQPPLGKNEIASTNDWMSSEQRRELSDERRFRFSSIDGGRCIDFWIRLTATDGDVHFGDTKEGTLGIRVADAMRVDASRPGKIENDNGALNSACWGKIANWVDYSGSEPQINANESKSEPSVGITIMYHPTSFRAPARWHVRNYGLFAHNPFGVSQFTTSKRKPAEQGGGFTLAEGESIELIYRIVIHRSGLNRSQIDQLWTAFSDAPPFTVPSN